MKQTMAVGMVLLLLVGILTGCASAANGNPQDVSGQTVTVRVAGLKGPTSMGLVKLMEDHQTGAAANAYEFSMAATADEITPQLVQGKLDMAAVPANLASVLYNNTHGAVQLLAVNTLGVTYIVERGDAVHTVADLKGKTVYATGKGLIPEYSLRTVLSENGIDPDTDLTLEFKSEATEIVSLLSEDPTAIAMLPQPYVTVAQNTVEGLRIALDLNAEWDALNNGSRLITGVTVVRTAFAAAHPEQVAAFLEEYAASVDYVNQNVEQAAQLAEKFGIVKAPVAQKAIPYCHITLMTGKDMKAAVSGLLDTLYRQNAAVVGGALPPDDFYYGHL